MHNSSLLSIDRQAEAGVGGSPGDDWYGAPTQVAQTDGPLALRFVVTESRPGGLGGPGDANGWAIDPEGRGNAKTQRCKEWLSAVH